MVAARVGGGRQSQPPVTQSGGSAARVGAAEGGRVPAPVVRQEALLGRCSHSPCPTPCDRRVG